MKLIAANILLLTVYAAGQSVVLAPPDQQEHHTEHVGSFIAVYHPPIKHSMKPTLVVGSGADEQNCYVTYDDDNVPHSFCESAVQWGTTDLRMYLRNFHGANGEFTALMIEHGKCDPLGDARAAIIRTAVNKENMQVTSTFDYQEKGRSDITVSCTYVDSKGITKMATARYNILVFPRR
jgi:hypothetical protein